MKNARFTGKRKSYPTRLPTTLNAEFIADFQSVIDTCTAEAATLFKDLAFKFKYLQQSWASKYTEVSRETARTRRNAAIEKWLHAETRNEKTNRRLLLEETTFRGGVTSQKLKSFARLVIRQTIGDTPPNDLFGEFTNGASTRVKRGPDAIARKFVGEAHVTEEAADEFISNVIFKSEAWHAAANRGDFSLVTQHGSMMFTVPKNSEIDRVACKEPEINMFLQRGVGLYLRTALKKRRIDLQDQTPNQRLALEGSVTKKLATLDLSSASDLISTQLVYDLLPLDWFLLLDKIRVKRVLIKKDWHELNMFSSMGNGFTFELESLIFYALTCAINRAYGVRGRVSVYGDDIITPNGSAAIFPSIFAWFGFKVNSKKSFWTGNFRESCGKHYMNGTDVSPFFIRGPLLHLHDLMHQLNLLRDWATRNGEDFWTPELYCFWVKWSKRVPRHLHGGKDVQDKSCLSTVCRPRKRLQAEKRVIDAPVKGTYLQWLATRDKVPNKVLRYACGDDAPTLVKRVVAFDWAENAISNESLITSEPELELAQFRAVKNRTWDRSLPANLCWFQELCCEAGS